LLHRAQKANAIVRDISLDDLVCVVTAIALAVPDNPSKTRFAHLVAVFFDGIGVNSSSQASSARSARGSKRRSPPRCLSADRPPR
jgi:hypothetical protein